MTTRSIVVSMPLLAFMVAASSESVENRGSAGAAGSATQDGWYGRYVWFHSHFCIPCRRVRRSLERTVSLLHELRDEPAPAAPPPAAPPDRSD